MSSRHYHTGHAGHPMHLSLLEAAEEADETAVLRALLAGADVNMEDGSGKTIIGCTIAGRRWQDVDASDASYALQSRLSLLKTFIKHDKISLFALNAPQAAMKGVTPLGLGAWLNIPDIVRVLLEECPGLVAVDGVDSLGATPLMYAARDGSIAVVQCLLTHGARPDLRDANNRTSIQYALAHPQALWLCESSLRRHRARETVHDDNIRNLSVLNPELDELLATAPRIACHPRLALKPSKQELQALIDRLVECVRNCAVQKLSSLLFPPVSCSPSHLSSPLYLINYPDAEGWSPIHHCVAAERPSLTVLDILYRAGADMSLYTASGHGTPLHCLAHKARRTTAVSIRAFIWHLVIDLRAPLAARDHEMETCIHIAAEHGQSLEVLAALLACDRNGSIRDLRNARGLTALEVAKPEFRGLFGNGFPEVRCTSSASIRTIKPSITSFQSRSSLSSLDFANLRSISSATSSPQLSEVELETFPHMIMENMSLLASLLVDGADSSDVHEADSLILQTVEIGEDLFADIRRQISQVTRRVDKLRGKTTTLKSLLDDLQRHTQANEGSRLTAIEAIWDTPDHSRRRTTDSGDSDSTAVSNRSSVIGMSTTIVVTSYSNNASHPKASDTNRSIGTIRARSSPLPTRLSLLAPPKSLRPVRSMVNLGRERDQDPSRVQDDRHLLKLVSPWIKEHTTRKGKVPETAEDVPTKASEAGACSEPSKSSRPSFRAWLKRKLAPETQHSKMAVVKEVDENVEDTRSIPVVHPKDTLAQVKVLAAAQKDLILITAYVERADDGLARATRYVARASKILDRLLERAKSRVERARLIQRHAESTNNGLSSLLTLPEPDHFVEFPPVTIPTSPRNSQLIFPRPPASLSSKPSLTSLSSTQTLIEGDDDDLRVLQTLLTETIDSRIDSALSDADKIDSRLRIVKSVVRTLKRTMPLPASQH